MTRVALGAGGAGWEPEVLAGIEQHPELTLARRCLDAADLVAVAETGQCDVALVDASLPGLDVDLVDRLHAAGTRVFSVDADAVALGIENTIRASRIGDVASDAPVRVAPTETRGHVVAVWGPTGAPGRSTLALNLAAAAQAAGLSTVLVDADTHGGSIAQQLAIVDDVSALMASTREANQGRLGSIEEHLVALDSGLHVLTGLPRADMWVHVRAKPFSIVLDALAARHEVVVVDIGFGVEVAGVSASSRDQISVHVLERADTQVVVGRADPVGITRLVRALDEAAPLLAQPHVVINGVRRSLGWTENQLVAAVRQLSGHEVSALIPWDQSAVDEALMAGQPVRESTPGSAYALRVDLLLKNLRQVIGSRPACTG